MKHINEAICTKVTDAIEILQKAAKNDGRMNAIDLSKLLHAIRVDAQAMEDGLKLRKKIMTEAGLEEQYQQSKIAKNVPPGINKIAGIDTTTKEPLEFEIIIKDKKEVIYQTKVFSGVVCAVEQISDIDESGAITGVTQKFHFGQPLAVWYAFNQLEISMEDKKVETMLALKSNIMQNKLMDPVAKAKLLEAMNGGR